MRTEHWPSYGYETLRTTSPAGPRPLPRPGPGPGWHVREYVSGPTYKELATTLEATDVIVGLALHAYARSIYYDDDFDVGNLVLSQAGPVFIDHDCVYLKDGGDSEDEPFTEEEFYYRVVTGIQRAKLVAAGASEDINVYDDEVESYGAYVRRVGLGGR